MEWVCELFNDDTWWADLWRKRMRLLMTITDEPFYGDN